MITLGAGVAWAQRTGGSMGGGSFGGGGSSYSSSSSSYSSGSSSSSWGSSSGSSSSYSGGSSSYSGGSGGSAGDLPAWAIFAILGLVVVVVVGQAMFEELVNRQPAYIGGSYTPVLESVDVSALYIAVDPRARKKLQQRFAQIAETCDTTTTEGLLKMLREVALELRRARDSWLYVGAMNAQPMFPSAAESAFHKQVQQARAGFEDEILRAADGRVIRGEVPDITARTEEGEGLVLVTVVVAANGNLYDITNIHDPDQVRRALEGMSALTKFRLVAVEVIWTPAAEDDRMSSVELEARYPFMVKVPEAVAGKVTCKFCGGGFPAELLSCPHCGGVAEAA